MSNLTAMAQRAVSAQAPVSAEIKPTTLLLTDSSTNPLTKRYIYGVQSLFFRFVASWISRFHDETFPAVVKDDEHTGCLNFLRGVSFFRASGVAAANDVSVSPLCEC